MHDSRDPTASDRRPTPQCLLVLLGLAILAFVACRPPATDQQPHATTEASDDGGEPGAFVYAARRGGDSSLWVTEPGGDAPAKRLTSSSRDNWPVLSTDGRWLAFQSQRDGNYEIYRMSVEGGDAINLTRHAEHDGLPVFSPDGERIAFFSNRGVEAQPRALPGHLYLVDAAGREDPVRLTETPLSSTYGPSDWSPDGARLLFSRIDADTGRPRLVELELATGRESPLAGIPSPASSGTYSPDGSRIAYSADHGERADIVVVDRDGRNARVLTPDAGHRYYPAFSPDGRWIAFTLLTPEGDTDLACVSIDTGEIRTLLATPEPERELRWLSRGRNPADFGAELPLR